MVARADELIPSIRTTRSRWDRRPAAKPLGGADALGATFARALSYDSSDAPTITRFHADDSLVRILIGPVGSGKTSACVMEGFLRGYRQAALPVPGESVPIRPIKIMAARNTYSQLESTTIESWRQWYSASDCPIRGQGPYDGRMRLGLEDGTVLDIQVLFLALNRPADLVRLLSLEATLIWANEVREMPKSIFDALVGRRGRYPPKSWGPMTWSGVIGDSNPPDDDHWLAKLEQESQGVPASEEGVDRRRSAGGPLASTDPLRIDPDRAVAECRATGLYEESALDEIRKIIEGVRLSPEQYRVKFFRQPGALVRTVSGILVPNVGVGEDRIGRAENVAHQQEGFGYWIKQCAASSSAAWIDVNVLGRNGRVYDGRGVYADVWRPEWHISAEPLAWFLQRPLRLAWDFGFVGPACTISQLRPNGQLAVLRAIVSPYTGFDRFLAEHALPVINGDFAGCRFTSTHDPSDRRDRISERTCRDHLALVGIDSEPCVTNEWQVRRSAVESRLCRTVGGGEPALIVDPSCKPLIEGFNGGYRMRRVSMGEGQDRFKDEAVKDEFSDPQDCLQYDCVMADNVTAQKTQKPWTPRSRPVSDLV